MCWGCFFHRWTLESLGSLEPRRSALEEDFEEEEEKEDNEQPADELEDRGYEKVPPFLYSVEDIVFYCICQMLIVTGSKILI